MKKFMDENFLLGNEAAIRLFHEYAREMPIYDYHCHINPRQIWEDRNFRNITEAWLDGDHYKWRAMRLNGIDEKYITGDADDYEKFCAWAATLEKAVGNPLYHWTHLELQRYFAIFETLDTKSADRIWHQANQVITSGDLSVRKIIARSNVKVICTTDDPLDDLRYHQRIRESGVMQAKVLPTFRPDKAVEIQRGSFVPWVKKLEQITKIRLSSYRELLKALEMRVEFFHEHGCRLSDHALDTIPFDRAELKQIEAIYSKAMSGESIADNEAAAYKTSTLLFLSRLYSQKGWVMQIHTGAMRNNNTRMLEKLGPDTGFDSINDSRTAQPLSMLLDEMDKGQNLPKTILYTLNPAANYILGTMMGNFCEAGIGSKIQLGSGWWFNDQKEGMREQLKTFANLGMLSRFVGMLTDSRSFLSYTRHEYFRRILCDLLGDWVENGEYPDKIEFLGQIVQDICFNNARDYFAIEV